jgi:F-type H+-transporting ATPase subunit beta
MLGLEQLSPEDRKVVGRARRLERFLTQPFFTTEQFTNLKGRLVSLKDSLDGCERILRDEFENVPESALYMIGAIAEAKADHRPEAQSAAKAAAHAGAKPAAGSPAKTVPEPHTTHMAKPQAEPEHES